MFTQHLRNGLKTKLTTRYTMPRPVITMRVMYQNQMM